MPCDWLIVFPAEKWVVYLDERRFSIDRVVKDNPEEILEMDRFFICVSSPINRIIGDGLILERHFESFIFDLKRYFKFNVKHFVSPDKWKSDAIPFDYINAVLPKPGGILRIDKNTGDGISSMLENIKPDGKRLLDRIIDEIKQFNLPKKKLNREESYHLSLYAWLKKSFPSTRIEEQRGGARPDIVIDDVAIEVKGPTTSQDLNSIANKCLIYPQYFHGGTIIVLFDVNVGNRRYNEWLRGMNNALPNVRIIRK